MARTGSDLNEAEAVLSWAEQSFASWPTERALTFSDVVHYMAVSEYLVDTGAESAQAEAIARSVPGVRNVYNGLGLNGNGG